MKKLLLLLLLLPILTLSQNCVPTTIIINLDQYQGETSWDVKDSTGYIVAAGSGYWSQPDYGIVVEQRCLPVGDLTFTIYDSYGDGLNGALWGGLDGSYYIVQCFDTIVTGTDAAFGNDTAHVILSAPCPPVFGCMDSSYVEFNPRADTSDGSCSTLIVFGCIDSTMYNYNALANTMSLVPACVFTLTLTDLIGDGWAPTSNLEVKHGDSTWNFTLDTAAYLQEYIINLKAPQEVSFKFSISSQAMQSASHCGFKLTNPLGMIMIEVAPPFIQPLFTRTVPTYCGNYCIDRVFGCMDSLALNYVDTANTNTQCFYVLGCTNSSYLEYYTQGFVADTSNGSCLTQAVWGCDDATAFNYNALANINNGGCVPVIIGCMQALAFNYNPQANTPSNCIAVVFGCMSQLAINYDSLANTDDGSCLGIIYGCTDTSMWNYSPNANVDNGECLPYIYGCMDATQFNYDPLANTDNSSCIEYIYGCMDTLAFNYNPLANTDNSTCIGVMLGCTNPIALNYCDTCNTDDFTCVLPIYGCTDSIMFNFNPLANVDNNTCIPFIYGCTDPSSLNFNLSANTEDFSCIAYMYGCMDTAAFNYDSTANTDNGSCVVVVEGCMDVNAYNYNVEANVNDSTFCLYSANCINGPGNPYWLNDPCYAWVIEVDSYCCDNQWDTICQATYTYCSNGWSGDLPLVRKIENNIKIFPNPTTGIIHINKVVDIQVYDNVGKLILSGQGNIIDLSPFSKGIYNTVIKYNNQIITNKIIKK